MLSRLFYQVLLSLVLLRAAFADGDGSFLGPLKISGFPVGAVAATAGDFNADGTLDLAAADGSDVVAVFLQDPLDRSRWTPQPALVMGNANYFVMAADWDGDGDSDLAVADPGSGVYYLASRGDGTFERARAVAQTRSSRNVAPADYDGDGDLDLAATNDFNSFSIHRGHGDGTFTFVESYSTPNVHDMLTLDYDADGRPDVMAKTKETGIFPFQGVGDGTMRARLLIDNLAVRGPIAGGEFDHDGKGDLITGYSVGISRGDASYRKVLEYERPFMPVGAADFSGDGHEDAAVTTLSTDALDVYLGWGDGSFQDSVNFRLPGQVAYFIGRDLDGNGGADLIVVGPSATTGLSVLWSRAGERFLGALSYLEGTGPAKAMASGDLDRDGAADLFFSGSGAGAKVFLRPGLNAENPASVRITARNVFTYLEVADLNGDQVPDMAGASLAGGNLVIALLTAEGAVSKESSQAAGISPADLVAGRIDGDATLDFAVVCQGSNHIAVFLGQGEGAFAAARIVPTISKPRAAALADLDGDGFLDLSVISGTQAAVHYGTGDGGFASSLPLGAPAASFSDLAAADFDGDARQDLAAADLNIPAVRIWRSKPGREIEALEPLRLSVPPSAVEAADLNGDGLAEIVVTSAEGGSSSVLLNRGALAFKDAVSYGLGLAPLGHRLADLDGDGSLDLAAFDSREALILFGNRANASREFRRGDATGDGSMDLSDAVIVIGRLFLGGEPFACEDAADANDDAQLDLTDAVSILSSLFLGAGPLPPPGPGCGPDPTADSLVECAAVCR